MYSLISIPLVCLFAVLISLFTDNLSAVQTVTTAGDRLLPADDAAKTMRVPEGFQVSLFAGEPDVQQPIGFCIDDRGRLWVAEAYNYPVHGTGSGDRIVILEDRDGDGKFDKRVVFYDKLNYVTGIEVGFGGAWVMSPPNFYFIPDRNRDDQPDGPPQLLLDGFGNHANAHNLANGFAWGPDGWLYGTHGRTNWSMIGKPGTPPDRRQRFDGGVYRYHPTRHVWEPYADGTTNPWGIDWDDYGQPFICNCVNPHLFHVIAGAHYEPWRNRKSSQYAYRRIPTIADHLHFLGGSDIRAGIGTDPELDAGGGHAHCGMMVYLGDNWPGTYRNTVFMNNIHGRRINNDSLQRKGSGYTASHRPDVMISSDPWYMGVTLTYGPDGSVFASDWSDTGECHSIRNTQRETGRIFKISYGNPKAFEGDVAKLTDRELVSLQLHRNDWHVRHARRILQERASSGRPMSHVHDGLMAIFRQNQDVTRKLRAMWALHVTGGLSDEFLNQQLTHSSEHVRAWAITLICESGDPTAATLKSLNRLAATDQSQLARLHLASALQRLTYGNRWDIARRLIARAEDAGDANLPLMYWYAIEPLVQINLPKFLSLAEDAKIPALRQFIARRAAALPDTNLALGLVLDQLIQTNDALVRADLLVGILQGVQGRRRITMPMNWPVAYKLLANHPVRGVKQQALQLAVIFDDPEAMETLLQQAINPATPAPTRNRALKTLITSKQANLESTLLELLSDTVTQRTAIRGLAQYNHPDTATTILNLFPELDAESRQDAMQTLASRSQWGMALLDAIESQRVPRTALTAITARQLRSIGDTALTARVISVWGEVRETSGEKAKQIDDLEKQLSRKSFLAAADLAAGHAMYQKNCANCHLLFGRGEDVGPDLTGSQRANLRYMLENLIDPNAVVSQDYMMSIFQMIDGRIVTGLSVAQDEHTITIQTANEKLVIPVDEIEERRRSRLSLMPEGILRDLSVEQIRDLLSYLSNPPQHLRSR